jgi:hypothetical protein
MLVNPFKLAERARFYEDNGARLRADQLREALDRQGCCTECGSKLIFEEEFYQKYGYWLCPICDGYRHYN